MTENLNKSQNISDDSDTDKEFINIYKNIQVKMHELCQKLENKGTIERLALIKEKYSRQSKELFQAQKQKSQKLDKSNKNNKNSKTATTIQKATSAEHSKKSLEQKKIETKQQIHKLGALSYEILCKQFIKSYNLKQSYLISNQQHPKSYFEQINRVSTSNQISNKFNNSTNNLLRKILKIRLKKRPVPDHLRNDIWLECSNANFNIYSQNINYYDTLKKINNHPDIFDDIIHKDLMRTPDYIKARYLNQDFEDKEMQKQEQRKYDILYNVLAMTARRNNTVGYCQGMNFIAAFINKQGFNEEETFWLLQHLLEQICPIDYYTSMDGVTADSRIFSSLLKFYNYDIYEKFQKLNIDIQFFTMEWFITLYTNQFQPEIVKIVLDHIFIQGSITILKVGLIILNYCKQQILDATDFFQVIQIVQQVSKSISNAQQFNKELNEIYLSQKIINISRQLHTKTIYQEKEKYLELLRQKYQNNTIWDQIQCDRDWPICKTLLHKEKILKTSNEFFAYKIQENLQITNPNYFEYSEKPAVKRKVFKQKTENINDLVISRQSHICNEFNLQKSNMSKLKLNPSNLKLQQKINIKKISNQSNQELHLQNKSKIKEKFIKSSIIISQGQFSVNQETKDEEQKQLHSQNSSQQLEKQKQQIQNLQQQIPVQKINQNEETKVISVCDSDDEIITTVNQFQSNKKSQKLEESQLQYQESYSKNKINNQKLNQNYWFQKTPNKEHNSQYIVNTQNSDNEINSNINLNQTQNHNFHSQNFYSQHGFQEQQENNQYSNFFLFPQQNQQINSSNLRQHLLNDQLSVQTCQQFSTNNQNNNNNKKSQKKNKLTQKNQKNKSFSINDNFYTSLESCLETAKINPKNVKSNNLSNNITNKNNINNNIIKNKDNNNIINKNIDNNFQSLQQLQKKSSYNSSYFKLQNNSNKTYINNNKINLLKSAFLKDLQLEEDEIESLCQTSSNMQFLINMYTEND